MAKHPRPAAHRPAQTRKAQRNAQRKEQVPTAMNDQLIALAITVVPEIIARTKELFHHDNPDDPLPTDEEVIAAYEAAFQSSLAKDDQWLAAHPEAAPPMEPVTKATGHD